MMKVLSYCGVAFVSKEGNILYRDGELMALKAMRRQIEKIKQDLVKTFDTLFVLPHKGSPFGNEN